MPAGNSPATPRVRWSPGGESGGTVPVSALGREWALVLRAVAALVASIAVGMLLLN